jgi:hypothetical protein
MTELYFGKRKHTSHIPHTKFKYLLLLQNGSIELLAFLTGNQQVPGLNLDRRSAILTEVPSWFSSVCQGKCQDSTLIGSRTLPSTYFQSHFTYHPKIDAIKYELLKASLNNHNATGQGHLLGLSTRSFLKVLSPFVVLGGR